MVDRNQKRIASLKTLQDLVSVEEKQAEHRAGWGEEQPMNQPLESLEDLILASLNPRAITGLPHPLSKFAANGAVKEGPYADAIIEFIKDWTCEAPESARHGAAMWFLFQSRRESTQGS